MIIGYGKLSFMLIQQRLSLAAHSSMYGCIEKDIKEKLMTS